MVVLEPGLSSQDTHSLAQGFTQGWPHPRLLQNKWVRGSSHPARTARLEGRGRELMLCSGKECLRMKPTLRTMETGDVAHLVECLPNMNQAQGSTPILPQHWAWWYVICNLSTWEVETGRSKGQVHPQLATQ